MKVYAFFTATVIAGVLVWTLTSSAAEGHRRIVSVPCLEDPLIVFETVWGTGRPSWALCSQVRIEPGMEVLDVGTGTGIQALVAFRQGARRVVATDINPVAVENALYNAKQQGWGDRLDVRLVSLEDPGAYAVIRSDERFDLIVCDPPFYDGSPVTMKERAGLDEGHELTRSLLAGLRQHLKPHGRLLMVFWKGTGLELLRDLAAQHQLQLRVVAEDGLVELDARALAWLQKRVKDEGDWSEDLRIIVVEITPI